MNTKMVKRTTAELLRKKLVEATRLLSDLTEEIMMHDSWAKSEPEKARAALAKICDWPQYKKAEQWVSAACDPDELERATLK
jgi:hypothetical protein